MEGFLRIFKSDSSSYKNLREWQQNINRALMTDADRQKLKNYFKKEESNDAIEAILFWEICHELVPDEWNISTQPGNTEGIFTKVKGILNYVAINKVNIDHAILKNIEKSVKKKKYEETMKNVFQLKQIVAQHIQEMLDDIVD